MIVDQEITTSQVKSTNENTSNSQTFQNKFIWKEGLKGKWFLDKRECVISENANIDPEIILFDMSVFDLEQDDKNKVISGDTVISELGKLKVNKVEDNQAFLQLVEEELPVPLESVRKWMNVNFIILGKTKTHLFEKFLINLNSDVKTVKILISEYLNIPENIMQISFNDKLLENDALIYSLEIVEHDTLLIGFIENVEYTYKRSGSKTNSLYEQKHVIPFIVDKAITVSAFGFFRHEQSASPATYDFFLYEVNEDGSKILTMQLLNVNVLAAECDENYVKKVDCQETYLKADQMYHAYVHYKISDMKTYYSYAGSSDIVCNGVRFRMLEINELGFKCSNSSGHMPYIFFKISNPYEI